MINSPRKNASPWASYTLVLAGIYNIAWGAIVILFPMETLSWFLEKPPTYPQFWQCIGMIVGCYGVGYWIASRDPYRHWPITLVGLLGKVFGPIGFLGAVLQNELPLRFGLVLISNDFIWWIPFSLILLGAYRKSR